MLLCLALWEFIPVTELIDMWPSSSTFAWLMLIASFPFSLFEPSIFRLSPSRENLLGRLALTCSPPLTCSSPHHSSSDLQLHSRCLHFPCPLLCQHFGPGSAGHIMLTLTQAVGSGRPQRKSNPDFLTRSRALYRLS